MIGGRRASGSPSASTDPYREARRGMVERHLAARDIRSPTVLRAMGRVRRELFLPERLREFAYEDSPLPVGEGQTISQPYIVAFMVDALELEGGERVLEIGTGSGYAAAVLAEIAGEVYTIERHESLAESARKALEQAGYHHVQVIHADGTLGWPEAAPYDGIVVAAGGPSVPHALQDQLAVGGRLVIPVGPSLDRQALMRITRHGPEDWAEETLAAVRFVPLVGAEGWAEPGRPGDDEVGAPSLARFLRRTPKHPRAGEGGNPGRPAVGVAAPSPPERSAVAAAPSLPELIAEAAEPITGVERTPLDGLLDRIGDARVVLIGEASHGTSEFHRFRARITRKLIEAAGFGIVAVEADWPDAARIDDYVRQRKRRSGEWAAFSRFPAWMWRNREVAEFVSWLRRHNASLSVDGRVGFFGLDLYSLFTSIDAVLRYLEGVDEEAARIARERYGCLSPWQADPATYGRAATAGRYQECRDEVAAALKGLLEKRMEYAARDGEGFLDAVQNARLVANAERYYRAMYTGYGEAWNLRDHHMFDTLKLLLEQGGEGSRAVVWAHNSHVGEASATEMADRGQLNLGQLCREACGEQAYLIGMGTHTGTVAAAHEWGGPMEVMRVVPSQEGSWERLFHDTGVAALLLGLREGTGASDPALRERFLEPRVGRAIGVIYRPRTESASHYFTSRLGDQFDEYVWFDETRAVTPLGTVEVEGEPETYPFGV